MAEVDFTVDEFIFNEDALKEVLEEGTRMLLNDTKKNAELLLTPNRGYMNSGEYASGKKGGNRLELTSNMKMKINVAKSEGRITFQGTQNKGWGKPVRNNEVAFINEYGAPGRSMGARQFMLKSCVELRSDEIEALKDIIK